MVPPHCANAGVEALTPCRVITFDHNELQKDFDEDPRFSYLMMQRTAQAISGRLRDLRIESLAYSIEQPQYHPNYSVNMMFSLDWTTVTYHYRALCID